MSSGYRLGLRIVVLTFMLSGAVCLAFVRPAAPPAPAGRDLAKDASSIGPFALVERSGGAVTDATLQNRVWIASFVFTRCQLSCPRITSIMKSLQERLGGSDVLLVSLSVDPEHDTPEVLREYADRFGADPSKWWFLTGDEEEILTLINRKFLLTAMANPSPAPDGSDEAVIHSDRLALVDRGKLVGLFDSNDPQALDELVAKAERSASPTWLRSLPTVNATLNALCSILLVLGWRAIYPPTSAASQTEDAAPPETLEPTTTAIARLAALLRSPATRGHLLGMGLAILASAVFLGCYLVYHFFAGSVRFPGQGGLRWLYLTILLSHTILATFFVVPLVAVVLIQAVKGEYARHARVARVAFPIWLYVSVTGVVIYLMLYQLPLSTAARNI